MRRIQKPTLLALALGAFLGSAGGACAASFTFTTLNAGEGVTAYPGAVNSHDQVAGTVFEPYFQKSGFVWSNGNLTLVKGTSYLEAINDNGIAVGAASHGSTAYASYDMGTGKLTDVPVSICSGKGRGSACFALGINDVGEVVGTYTGWQEGVWF